MTSRQRLEKVLRGEIPDHVPVSSDTSNMIPARMTGKPFWDLYLYQDPPIWKAYIDCVKYFNFDSLMDGYVNILFEDLGEIDDLWREAIIFKNENRIITQKYSMQHSKIKWQDTVTVYYRDDPPTQNVDPGKIGFPQMPDHFEDIEGIKHWPQGEELLKLVKKEMGDHGLAGVFCGVSTLLTSQEEICDYYDNPKKYIKKSEEALEYYKSFP